MKELSIEQKAKRYDEAIERAKEWYNNPNSSSIGKSYLYAVFPELKDSEDERIRKEIIETFKILGDGKIPVDINYADIFTWLEKQGEQPKEATYTNEVETGNGNIKAMVTEKVQLPKFKVKYAGNEYNVLEIKESAEATFYGIEDEPNHIDYVKAENCEIISGYAIKENGSPYPTKPAVFSEQKPQRMVSAEAKEAMYDKPTDNDMVEALRTEYEKGRADAFAEMQKEWSEEDKDFMYDTLSNLTELKDRYGEGYGNVGKCIDWLKSIKDKVQPQPKQEWSEDDEAHINGIIDYLLDYKLFVYEEDMNVANGVQKELDWLKSLQRIGG